MLNKYDIYAKLTLLGGYTGRALVWIGMACGAVLFWYLLVGLFI